MRCMHAADQGNICLGEQSFNDLDAQKLRMEIHSKIYFFQCRVLSYGPFDTLNTKVLEKIISGGLFMTPTQNTLQCTVMYCSVKA